MTAAFKGGVSEFQLGHFEGAVRCFEEAAYAAPSDARVLMWLASAYLQNQQVEAAVTVYRRLLSFSDPGVRRFAQNGIRACGQPDLAPALKSTLIAPLIETELTRMPSLSVWDITTAAFRIAGEEWSSFALSSFSGYFLLLASAVVGVLLLVANAALSGNFTNFLNFFYRPGSNISLLKSGFYPLALAVSTLFVAWGIGNWLMSLLLVQRWTYYVYVGQAYPFWQTQQTFSQRLHAMGWSTFVAVLLSLPLCLTPSHMVSFKEWSALFLGLVIGAFLACSLVALPVIAVENKNAFSALVRSWQLSYRYLWLVACLALLILFIWPSLCFSLSGWAAGFLPGQWPIVARFAVRIFIIFGLYTLAFPGIGTLLGTVYYDLVTRSSDRD